MDHSPGASPVYRLGWLVLDYFSFLNAAIRLSFTPSVPPSFPVRAPLWVTDTQGKVCVCRRVQAGCYCHQEQSHLLPNTWFTTDQEAEQGKIRSLLNTHFCLVVHKTQKCNKHLGNESYTYYKQNPYKSTKHTGTDLNSVDCKRLLLFVVFRVKNETNQVSICNTVFTTFEITAANVHNFIHAHTHTRKM